MRLEGQEDWCESSPSCEPGEQLSAEPPFGRIPRGGEDDRKREAPQHEPEPPLEGVAAVPLEPEGLLGLPEGLLGLPVERLTTERLLHSRSREKRSARSVRASRTTSE